ncbi:MAG: DUF3987 domain-containing protein, partial [Candidatus Solibacter sp.]|nr:DUF3987 domain-containing protein [Candidatus Solibacter sp.]
LSMCGGIQPNRLAAYVSGGNGVPLGDDGLIQRFQLLVWPDVSKEFQYVDRAPDTIAQQQFARILECLTGDKGDGPALYCFDAEAQELFVWWLIEHEQRVRRGGLSPLMSGHLAKYRSLFPSLALLFEMADQASEHVKKLGRGIGGFGGFYPPTHLKVTYGNAFKAYCWTEYLESHAARIYAVSRTPEQWVTKQLADRIASGAVSKAVGSDIFSCRDIEHKNWKGLNSTERVKTACLDLE